ncbi:hypothetical protein SpAn4DRAFT_5116 [Sporomusa ovata]|uniref:Uncharacterized protein n=1 Tax=Sporomusa ovata TaxID=2378 RepID=A0A0U1L1N6_9FIRM|nr:hypothetical protein SpAn4DRAFT_5116 [Sporomusa ovata]
MPLLVTALPSRRMTPLTLFTLCARMTPLLLTTVFKSLSLVPALMTARPPVTVMVPVLVALPFSAPVSTATLRRLSPLKSRLTLLPAARPVTLAAMTPSLATWGPMSTASLVAVMVP